MQPESNWPRPSISRISEGRKTPLRNLCNARKRMELKEFELKVVLRLGRQKKATSLRTRLC